MKQYQPLSSLQLNLFTVVFFLFFLVITGSGLVSADQGTESPQDTAVRLQAKYDSITSLQFDFNQSVSGQMARGSKKGAGNAVFVKPPAHPTGQESEPALPGRMRWNYHSPDRQILINDGTNFSMYFEKLQQMIISPADSMQTDLTYSFFSGRGRLMDDFIILPPDKALAGEATETSPLTVIKLIPRQPQSQVASIHLWATTESMIQRIEILDHFDTRTVLNLSHIEVNQLTVDDRQAMGRLFSFTPPDGTEVIRQ
ncbi:MAG: outer membrane lipoprotein carrier protein LolA [Thermodesulfobacteriota bacterium]